MAASMLAIRVLLLIIFPLMLQYFFVNSKGIKKSYTLWLKEQKSCYYSNQEKPVFLWWQLDLLGLRQKDVSLNICDLLLNIHE